MDWLEHVVVGITIVLSIPTVLWRVKTNESWLHFLHTIMVFLLFCPYIPFAVYAGWKHAPERALLSLLGWTRLNGTLLEIFAFENVLLAYREKYREKRLFSAGGVVTLIAIVVQATGIGYSVKEAADDDSIKRVILHVGGMWSHFWGVVALSYCLKSVPGKFNIYTMWPLLVLILLYLIVLACEIGLTITKTRRRAFMWECITELAIVLMLAHAPTIHINPDKRSDLEEGKDSSHGQDRAVRSSTTPIEIGWADNSSTTPVLRGALSDDGSSIGRHPALSDGSSIERKEVARTPLLFHVDVRTTVTVSKSASAPDTPPNTPPDTLPDTLPAQLLATLLATLRSTPLDTPPATPPYTPGPDATEG